MDVRIERLDAARPAAALKGSATDSLRLPELRQGRAPSDDGRQPFVLVAVHQERLQHVRCVTKRDDRRLQAEQLLAVDVVGLTSAALATKSTLLRPTSGALKAMLALAMTRVLAGTGCIPIGRGHSGLKLLPYLRHVVKRRRETQIKTPRPN